jgi:YVTN family beta-propeller protein
MNPRSFIVVSLALLLAGSALFAAGRMWGAAHVRRWSGRTDLGFVNCSHCHLQSIEKLPWAKERRRHAAPGGIALAPDGKTIYVALDELNELVEADVASAAIKRRLAIEGAPFGVVCDAAGEHLYVTCRDSDMVVAIDAREMRPLERIAVGAGPAGIAYSSAATGERLVVANSVSDNISVLATKPLREMARPRAGREPYAAAISLDGSRAFVSSRLAVPETYLSVANSELTVLDAATGRIAARELLHSAHLSEGVAVAPGLGWSLTPLIKVRNLVPITQVASGWVMSSGLAVREPSGRMTQLPLDEAHDFFADPSAVVADPAGARAYIASGGSDVVTVVDLERMARWLENACEQSRAEAIDDLSLAAEYVVARIPTARNPRQLALSPCGRQLFVAERLASSILIVDTATLKPAGRIVLGTSGRDDPVRRGEMVFTDAQYTFQRQFSCRSCHPDGHVDGLSYDFDGDGLGDNLLDNRSLLGVAGTEPMKWVGKNPNLEIQCGPRFARVLMRTDPIPPAELSDLTTFLKSQPPANWKRNRNTPLTPAQERGKTIFFATKTSLGQPIPRDRQCHTCHRPPLFTNRLLSSVGTRGPHDVTDMFDTPHLLGIGLSAPYLHDGRAKTLEELWTIYQTNDLHGVTSHMNKHELNDLVEYLKTI